MEFRHAPKTTPKQIPNKTVTITHKTDTTQATTMQSHARTMKDNPQTEKKCTKPRRKDRTIKQMMPTLRLDFICGQLIMTQSLKQIIRETNPD